MPNIIRIRNLQVETELSGVTFPVDKQSYSETAKQINILDLKNYILSGVTGATYDLSRYFATSGGTLSGDLIGQSATFNGDLIIEQSATFNGDLIGQSAEFNSDLSGQSATFNGSVTASQISSWSLSNDVYALVAMGISGSSRHIFEAGVSEVTNGFTVDYNYPSNRMVYTFLSGDIISDGSISANTFVKTDGGADQSLQADGGVRTLVSGNAGGTYNPTLINVDQISDSVLSHATFSRVGDVIHVMISGHLTPSGNFPVLELSLPTTPYYMMTGVKIGVGTLWNWASGNTATGYIETNTTGNTVYFHSNISDIPITGMLCDFVTEFDYSLIGITTTTTTTLAPTTTTTTTTLAPAPANVHINNTSVNSGGTITSVTVNGINITGVSFPVTSGETVSGQTDQIGTYTIQVGYTIDTTAGIECDGDGPPVCEPVTGSGTINFASQIISGDIYIVIHDDPCP